MVRRVGVLAVLVAMMGFLGGCKRDPMPSTSSMSSDAPPLLAVTGAQLEERVRASQSEVVLVNIWATWCLPCREEFPALVRLSRELPQERLDLVLVSADFPDQAEMARQFLAEQGVTFPSYIKEGKDQEFIDAVSERWSGALPATLVYDRSRRLVRFWEGGASFEEFRAAVDMAAGEAAGKG
ncbi:MAG: TlpA family protein disulfide reductase [Acidobacteriota bacterium]|jgi:thiol-disulfide isomerase/thioredoxin